MRGSKKLNENMATIKQKKALNALVENGGNISQAMIAADYSLNTAHTPQKLTESQGFQELLEENGFTDDFLIKALREDIEKKPQNRIAELSLGFKIKGRLSDNPVGTQNNLIVLASEILEKNDINRSPEADSEGSASLPSVEVRP